MADNSNNPMAQAVFLAQLEAAKGKCSCAACRVLRRASDMMTAQFLKLDASGSPQPLDLAAASAGPGLEEGNP